ncbi:hypothetical protein MKJ04_14255 [Pontibacter sp. E15-1]|uniref:hypothetical protein n=1 Tax=Pontibacter sp. E15-1 TaxID=2919918 RepID=UPI001F4F235F|nr:hypothetical protein [Pontibacter sp. E15-1]MCJ8166006.1 hypothetical protein [Pontibacter sp. E15-1]
MKKNSLVKPQVIAQHAVQLRKLTEAEIHMRKVIRGFFKGGEEDVLTRPSPGAASAR